MSALRVVFMGTADLSCASLKALMEAPDLHVAAVVTQPDRPKGRDLKLQPSPVKELALRASLPVLQPERAREPAFLAELQRLNPDLIAVAAFGQILPASILELPRFGCLNVHTSLLPKYRGAAPIQWAMVNGESETGVTIMKMDAGMDTGAIISQETTRIEAEDDGETLHDRLAQIGAQLLVRTIPEYIAGKLQPKPQPTEGVSYAPKIKKQDGQINWNQSAESIWNRVRGLKPWPGAFTYLPGGQRHLLKIWQAEVVPTPSPLKHAGSPGEILQADNAGVVVGCGQGALRLLVLQREGGRRLPAGQFLAGHPLKTADTLG
jgi:methionyl-tRNA formyltransferase